MPATQHIKKATNLSINTELLAQAKSLGINLSNAAEHGIAEAIRQEKMAQWKEENASAIASSNAFVEANGLPLEKYRNF